LGLLRGLVEALARGQGGSALVVGESGAGKSALLEAAFGGWGGGPADGGLVVWAVGDEMGAEFPFLPWLDALRGVTPVAGTDGPRAGMVRLLRGQAGGGPGGAASGALGSGMDVVAAASELLVGWVEDVSAVMPVLVVFDDLQWADEASVRVWLRLVRAAGQAPVMVAGAMRPGYSRIETAGVRRRVAAEQAAGRGAVLELTALSPGEVGALVGGMCGGAPGPRLMEMLAAAGGNPLYVTELVAALDREGALAAAPQGRVEASAAYRPLALAEAVGGRLAAVGAEGRQVLAAAALLGVEFTVADLALASGRRAAELAGLLDQAQQAGVLAATRAGMAFRHPLIRDVLYEQMPAGVRAAWHLELARSLSAAGGAVAAVARQLSAALAADGQLPARGWVTDWLAAHGTELSEQAVPLAVTLLSQAWEQMPLGDVRRVALAVPLAWALQRVSRDGEVEGVARQTLATAPVVTAEQALELHLATAIVIPDAAAAIARLEAAEAERDWGARHLLLLQAMRARTLAYQGALEGEARSSAVRVLETAIRLHEPRSAGWACIALGNASMQRLDLDTAREYFGRGITVTETDPGSVGLHARLLAYQARTLLPANRYADAEAVLSRARALAESVGDEDLLFLATGFDIFRLFAVGNWDDLTTELDTAIERWKMVNLQVSCVVVVVARHRDDDNLAAWSWDSINSREPPVFADAQFFNYVHGVEAEHRGDARQALDSYTAALEPDPLGQGLAWMAAEVPLAQGVRLALARDDRDAAADLIRQAEEGMAGLPRFTAVLAHARGLLEADPGLVRQAVDYYRRVGKRLPLAQSLESLAAILVQRGQAGEARLPMTEALEVYDSLGAAWDAKRMRARFRPMGLRVGARQTRYRPATGWDSMTRTEAVVAGLVAEGLSNPQIAERLYLSRNTVQTHVSHILTKLNATSRIEIALTAARQPSNR
jgi:DNA-binding CsgD family transcriptional regulator